MNNYRENQEIRYYESFCIQGDGNITSQETFYLAREFIENGLELKLPLSALVLLRKYGNETTEEWKSMKDKRQFNAFYPPTEATARLFFDIFEMDYLSYFENRNTNGEELKEFLRFKMDEVYLM